MRYLSVCSGIEAATVAWHHMGWEPAGFSEIEKFPSLVLGHHYPDVPIFGDLTKIFVDQRVKLIFEVKDGCEKERLSKCSGHVCRWYVCTSCGGLFWRYEAVNVGMAQKKKSTYEAPVEVRAGESLLSQWVQEREVYARGSGTSLGERVVNASEQLRGVRQNLCTCEWETSTRGAPRRLLSPAQCALAVSQLPPRLALEQYGVVFSDASIEMLVGGFPCQDLSVAGKRKGLRDEQGSTTRSGLFYRISELCEALGQRWSLFENVPGLLSSNSGHDFASVVGELSGSEVDIPKGGWKNAGFVLGPKGLVEWAVLDAQYFGVPQRRRRVFIVRDTGNWASRPPILLEPESLLGDLAPSREAGQKVAPTVVQGPPYSLTGNERVECDAIVIGNVEGGHATTLSSREYKGLSCGRDGMTSAAVMYGAQPIPLDLRNAGRDPEKHDAVNRQGVGVGQPGDPAHTVTTACVHGVAQVVHGTQDPCVSDIAFAQGRHNGGENVLVQSIGFTRCDDGGDAVVDGTPTMRCGSNYSAHLAVAQPMAFTTEQTPKFNQNQALTLTKQSPTGGGQPQAVMTNMAVRRLTPTECERLQGFSDGYTNIQPNGKPTPDGPRYKALGNSMAVPVMRWIGERINQINNQEQ